MNFRFLNVVKGIIFSRCRYKIPLRVMHFVTFRCNLSCKYCGIWKTFSKEMSTKEAKKAIKEFADAGTFHWVFTGGEPLLRKDIGDLVNYLKDFGIVVTMTTNGTLIRRRVKELRNVDYFVVSLDGPEEVNDFVRGKGVYKKVIKNVEILKNYNFEVVLNATLSLGNVKGGFYGVKKIIELSEKLGARLNFSVIYKDNFNQADDFSKKRIEEILPERKLIIDVLDFIKDEKKRRHNKILLSNPNIQQLKLLRKWKKCYAGKLFCDLFPDGRVIPCLFKPEMGLNGLELGFKKAFKMLPEIRNCVCSSTCYNELNLVFSLNVITLYETLLKYFFLVR